MRYTKVLGLIEKGEFFSEEDEKKFKDLIRNSEEKLSSVFTELSLGYDNKAVGNGFGGDPLVFQLVYPVPHICDARAVYVDWLEKKMGKKLEEATDLTDEQKQAAEDDKKYVKKMGRKMLGTAATDGKRYYWNPEFVMGKDKIGIRIVMCHEAWHAIYMQPSRRGGRHPGLWNIAIDFKVNFTIMEDLKARGIKDFESVFKQHLGDYITFEEYAQILKDPFNPPPRLAHFNPMHDLKKMADPGYKHPGENAPPMYYADANLSGDFKKPEVIYEYLWKQIPRCPECGRANYKKPDEYKKLEKKLQDKMAKEAKEKDKKDKKNQKEEKHECECGNKHKHNHDKNDQKAKDAQKAKDKNQQGNASDDNEADMNGQPQEGNDGQGDESQEHQHGGKHKCSCGDEHQEGSPGENGEGQEQGQGEGEGEGEGEGQGENDGCGHECPSCGGGGKGEIDPLGFGGTLDEHIDTDVSEEELNKRIYEAVEGAKRMAGKIPGGLSDELGELISPKLTWQDFVRNKITKTRRGFGKNDWQSPKHRPMFSGLFVPRKKDYFLTILAAYDCSGSMGKEDIAYGISQLQVIDERGEMYLTPWDTVVYWDDMKKINKCDKDNLKTAVVKGRGGTVCGDVFRQYKDHVDKVDLIIMITDGFLGDGELKGLKPEKGVEVVWLVTSHNPHFKPPFGRVFHLHNE